MNTDYGYDNAGRLRTVKVATSLEATYTYDALDRLAIRALTNQTPSGTTHFIHMLGGGGAFDDLAPGLGDELGGRSIAVVCTPPHGQRRAPGGNASLPLFVDTSPRGRPRSVGTWPL